MTLATRLKAHLDSQNVAFETAAHPRTATASETAEVAHVSGDKLAKSVLIHHDDDYYLAVVPASHRVSFRALHELLGESLALASEDEIGEKFEDCDMGAVPPIGDAYGVPVLLDDSLIGLARVWFEGGDHRTLVSVTGADFDRLMGYARRGSFSIRR